MEFLQCFYSTRVVLQLNILPIVQSYGSRSRRRRESDEEIFEQTQIDETLMRNTHVNKSTKWSHVGYFSHRVKCLLASSSMFILQCVVTKVCENSDMSNT